MSTDSGLLQFLDVGAGTSVSASVGKVTGGEWRIDPNVVHRESIGAQDTVTGGPLEPGGSAEFMVSASTVIDWAIRSSFTNPSLTALCFIGGFNADARKQTGAVINTMNLKCAVGEPLSASIEWMCLTDVPDSSSAQSYLTTTVYEWFTGTATIGGNTLQCQSFDIALNNNCSYVYSLDATSSGTRRMPDAIHVGSQEVSVSVDYLTRPTSTVIADHTEDTLDTNNSCVFTFVGGTTGTQTMTITASNLSVSGISIPFSVGGEIISYSRSFEAKKDAASLSVAVA
ncbi:MAG: hypothetical protein BWY85_00346 [Firmicutes bacterium ADurb.Bin506]|nr:MAG: hypothetical protein BWY85_00346 [Firmicutes bacterium ADurb.Bin506]